MGAYLYNFIQGELKNPHVINLQDVVEIAIQCRNWQESVQDIHNYYYGYIALNVLCWLAVCVAAVTIIGLYVDYKIMSKNDKMYANPWVFYSMNNAHRTRKEIYDFAEEFKFVGKYLSLNM